MKTENVISKLEEDAHWSVATDMMWSSNSNGPYICRIIFTVHFVNPDWYLQYLHVLDAVPLFSDHVGQNIVEAFQDVHSYIYLQIGIFPRVMLQYPLQIMPVILYQHLYLFCV